MTSPHHPTLTRCLAAVLALIGWSALGINLHFILGNHRPMRILHAMVTFVSFFTLLSNLLVAIILTASVVRPVGRRGFLGARVAAAAVVYILVTGLVYTLLLRESRHPSVSSWAVDIVLHHVMPIAYPLFWLTMLPKRRLPWRDAFAWLIFPLAFAFAGQIRGRLTGWYPYTFLDTDFLGGVRVTANVGLLCLTFLVLGVIVIAINRALERRSAGC